VEPSGEQHEVLVCAGHYAQSLGLFPEAAARFAAAAEAEEAAMQPGRRLAALNQALAVLSQQGPDAVADATEVLKRHGLYSTVEQGIPLHER
jgi:hypothetical protein